MIRLGCGLGGVGAVLTGGRGVPASAGISMSKPKKESRYRSKTTPTATKNREKTRSARFKAERAIDTPSY